MTHQFKETGMEVFKLKSVMRNTVNIIRLMSSAARVIESRNNNSLLKKNIEVGDADLKISSEQFDAMRRYSSMDADEVRHTHICADSIFRKEIIYSVMEVDEAIQHGVSKSEGDAMQLAVGYSYLGCCTPSHTIQGPTPNIKKFNAYGNFDPDAFSLTFLVKDFLHNKKPGRLAILCMDFDLCRLLKRVLEILKIDYVENIQFGDRFSSNVRIKSMKDLQLQAFQNGQLLLTTVRGFRGMQCENVAVVVNSNEYILSHNIVQAIARCISNLTVILYVNGEPEKDFPTIKIIVDEWEKEKLVSVETFDSLQLAERDIVGGVESLTHFDNPDFLLSFSPRYSECKLLFENLCRDKDNGSDDEINEQHGVFGYTRLHVAAKRCDDEEAKELIAKGANIEAKSYYGNTPLETLVFDMM